MFNKKFQILMLVLGTMFLSNNLDARPSLDELRTHMSAAKVRNDVHTYVRDLSEAVSDSTYKNSPNFLNDLNVMPNQTFTGVASERLGEIIGWLNTINNSFPSGKGSFWDRLDPVKNKLNGLIKSANNVLGRLNLLNPGALAALATTFYNEIFQKMGNFTVTIGIRYPKTVNLVTPGPLSEGEWSLVTIIRNSIQSKINNLNPIKQNSSPVTASFVDTSLATMRDVKSFLNTAQSSNGLSRSAITITTQIPD